MFGRTSFASGLSLFLITADAGPAAVVVANFSAGDLSAWETQHFSGETQYAIEEVGGKAVVRAFSRDSASALFREIEVDLTETPVLRWRWKIDGTLEDNEERVKSGDDFPARVYVIRRHRLLFWKTEAINYVWSSGEPQGTAWPNAYTSNSRIVAVRSGNREAGQWRDEQRNVRQDFTQLFGKDVSTVHGVAIMTDTDNTGQSATAWYGDIRFTAD
ncbi:MAG: DUF3047 domain-containing protein [Gammaproteobacteria bacterium]|nr:DUF3047 domain-containing protein [Gammaproteobacteria bacterium]